MASSFSPNKNYEEQGTGDHVDSWGPPLNANFTLIDNNLAGTSNITLSNANVTLSQAQAQYLFYILGGTLTANVRLSFPSVGGFYVILNSTTGNFNVTVDTASHGLNVVVPQGFTSFVATGGANMYFASQSGITNLPTSVNIGGTISPPAIAAQANNYSPTGLSTATYIRLTVTGDQYMSGIAGPSDGRLLIMTVVTGSSITFLHNNSASTAANRLFLPDSSDLKLNTVESAIFRYDANIPGWVAVGVARNTQEVLTADRNYYVTKAGSDLNTGLSTSDAFLTIAHAFNVVDQDIQCAGWSPRINVGAGTWAERIFRSTQQNLGEVKLIGNVSNPASVILKPTSGDAVNVTNNAVLTMTGFKIDASTSGAGCVADHGGVLTFDAGGNMEFGTNAFCWANTGGRINFQSGYSITGSGAVHIQATSGGSVDYTGALTMTLSGTPNFTTAFAFCGTNGTISMVGCHFSGAATGTRYNVSTGGQISTNTSGSTTFFPGNVLGVANATSFGYYQ